MDKKKNKIMKYKPTIYSRIKKDEGESSENYHPIKIGPHKQDDFSFFLSFFPFMHVNFRELWAHKMWEEMKKNKKHMVGLSIPFLTTHCINSNQ